MSEVVAILGMIFFAACLFMPESVANIIHNIIHPFRWLDAREMRRKKDEARKRFGV